ncbi:MAG TPA: EAL domain-containing protein [Candidatus Omnitrophota bacterium]|jgi:EAL domain-containing protein (putative c-di-GMP-specific phosphodiesterase class I)|nr:EAL domain-containing protein [Candidatus Omnitrophota bacterium]
MPFKFDFFKKQRAEFKDPIHSVYQPIVDIATGDVIGYEALARSEKEMPAEMFRRSYEKGNVIPFDFHCLESAIKVLPELQEDQYLFLNIEPLTLEQAFSKGKEGEDFLKGLKSYAGKVVFELTEGVKKSDFAFIQRGVEFIRAFGYRFALDDIDDISAKTSQLASLKPDFLKIDLQLVQGIANNYLNQQIVREMVHLGRVNGSEMIAEGVEQQSDLNFIRNMGIRYAQGFFFAKPAKELIFLLQLPKE